MPMTLPFYVKNIDELAAILNIYDQTFSRFGVQISYGKTETMAFNVPEDVKSKKSLFSIENVPIRNVRTFKYLGHMITNNDDDPSHYLSFRISSAYQKWNELKHVFTDKRVFMRGKSGRVVKKSKKRVQSHKKSSQLLGPKMFDMRRMLAIFYVIVDEKVSSTAEIQSQVASLVTLQMLTQSGEDLDQPKYKCNVDLDFIRQVAKNVRFELHKYMYDVEY